MISKLRFLIGNKLKKYFNYISMILADKNFKEELINNFI